MKTPDEATSAAAKPAGGAPTQPPALHEPGAGLPGALTDVAFEGNVGQSWRDVAVFALLGCGAGAGGALLAQFAGTLPGGSSTRAGLLSGAILAVLLALRRWWGWRTRVQARTVTAGIDRHGLATAVYGGLDALRGMGATRGLFEILKVLVEQGRIGTSIRIGRANELVALEPLARLFEPQPLNEVHSALIGEQSDALKEPSQQARGDRSASQMAQSIRRNVLLKGGRWTLVLFGFLWITSLFKAIGSRTIMWQLLLYTLVLLLLLFGPANREFNQQWFIVPGGIVQRKAGWLQSRWKLHLFERRASALCVSHWWRKIWAVHVVDAQASARRMLTRTEAEFLLRAWLSPLPPPPLERLSDLG